MIPRFLPRAPAVSYCTRTNAVAWNGGAGIGCLELFSQIVLVTERAQSVSHSLLQYLTPKRQVRNRPVAGKQLLIEARFLWDGPGTCLPEGLRERPILQGAVDYVNRNLTSFGR